MQPVYDDTEFLVRNVIRFYGGWWSGRPCELKPAPRAKLANEIATLAGGARALADRAQTLAEDGDYRLACASGRLRIGGRAQPTSIVQAKVAAIYDARAQAEQSLMTVNIFNSAAAYARAGRAFV